MQSLYTSKNSEEQLGHGNVILFDLAKGINMDEKERDFDRFVIEATSEEGENILSSSSNLVTEGPLEKTIAIDIYDRIRRGTYPLYIVVSGNQYYLCY